MSQQVRTVFDETSELCPQGRGTQTTVSTRVYWLFKKRNVKKKQEELKTVQYTFVFMEAIQRTIDLPTNSKGLTSVSPQSSGRFEGILQQVPVEVTLPGSQQAFEVTMSLQPVAREAKATEEAHFSRSSLRTSSGERDESKALHLRLEKLRKSPYFSRTLLEDPSENRKLAEKEGLAGSRARSSSGMPRSRPVKEMRETERARSRADSDTDDEDVLDNASVASEEAAKDVDDLLDLVSAPWRMKCQ